MTSEPRSPDSAHGAAAATLNNADLSARSLPFLLMCMKQLHPDVCVASSPSKWLDTSLMSKSIRSRWYFYHVPHLENLIEPLVSLD